jgi:hypothetical protein
MNLYLRIILQKPRYLDVIYIGQKSSIFHQKLFRLQQINVNERAKHDKQ